MPLVVDATGGTAPVPAAADLRAEVGASASDDPVLERCIVEAVQMVDRHVEINGVDGVFIPAEVGTAAYLAVAADLWYRRNAPHGIVNQQFTGPTGDVTAPIRIARDPLAPAKHLLAQWLMPIGFA